MPLDDNRTLGHSSRFPRPYHSYSELRLYCDMNDSIGSPWIAVTVGDSHVALDCLGF